MVMAASDYDDDVDLPSPWIKHDVLHSAYTEFRAYGSNQPFIFRFSSKISVVWFVVLVFFFSPFFSRMAEQDG